MQPFYCKGGLSFKSLKDLKEGLSSMSSEEYAHHVSHDKNDFAKWVGDFFDKGLAMGLLHSTTQQEAMAAVERYLKFGHFVYETIIIGGGIAGIAASIYAARDRLNFIIISEDFGGQINVSGEIQNYPGFASTNATELGKKLKEQVEFNNIEFVTEKVKRVNKGKDGHFSVITDKGRYEAESILVCSGANARKLKVPGEKEFSSKGVTYCAICDGPLFRNKNVVVVGGGDAAMESAVFLQRIAKKIYILTINPQLKGHAYLMEQVLSKDNVEVIPNATTTRILGSKLVEGIEFNQNGKKKTLNVEGVFIEIGRIPNTDFIKGLVEMDKHGHIIINKFAETSVPEVYAAGDCTDIHEYQYVIAAGQAVTALLRAVKGKNK